MKFILNIDKPPDVTSHDVVDQIRRITSIKKVGHAGTLDPFATGVLIILIDDATKSQAKIMEQEKEYIGTIKLGQASDTFDKAGKIKEISNTQPAKKDIKKIFKNFIGEITQITPPYSAARVRGKRLYKLARKGIKIKVPRKVFVKSIEILDYRYPYLKINVICGSGTYIRSIANDIGEKLKTGGYLEELVRTKIGDYRIKDATKLEKLNKNNWKKYAIEII